MIGTMRTGYLSQGKSLKSAKGVSLKGRKGTAATERGASIGQSNARELQEVPTLNCRINQLRNNEVCLGANQCRYPR